MMAGIADALMTPFTWGQGGRKKTRSEVESDRAVAAALAARRGVPQNVGEGLNAIGEALRYNALNERASKAEEEGRASAMELYSGLNDGYDQGELMGLIGNEWADPAQSSVAQALLQQEIKKQDPAYTLDLDLKRAQLEAARAPEMPAERKYDKDASGTLRYLDTGEPVFGDAGGAAAPPPPNVEDESKLRTEYNGINTVKDFGLQTQAYQRVLDSAKDPSPAGDLALIFNYMKVLDPGSTVREGEFATAQNSGSLPDQVRAQYNKILSGERLVPEIRQDFVKRAGDLFQGAAGLQEGTNARYSKLAAEYGFDPSRIVAEVPKIGVLDPEFNLAEYLNPQTGQQTKPLPVTNEADYQAIPSGAQYVDPDGNVRVKK